MRRDGMKSGSRAVLAVLVLTGMFVCDSATAQQVLKKDATVSARVVQGSGAIQAALEPGEFEVPQGARAINLRYKHSSGHASLGCQIYSVTQKKEMCDGKKKGLNELPAGKYRFAVGGEPGAAPGTRGPRRGRLPGSTGTAA
jgi:hypothetical protein